ncbi:Hypothetical predicted protein [Octopus vulgaris]|uniref:Uncharacterized protein n=1 Tax=Octopus vulgaris TaxID=6645 RepID=A0AA36BGH5_OCTVU|nr:Hypothetical predicted protein [Octopus vulgaris]
MPNNRGQCLCSRINSDCDGHIANESGRYQNGGVTSSNMKTLIPLDKSEVTLTPRPKKSNQLITGLLRF